MRSPLLSKPRLKTCNKCSSTLPVLTLLLVLLSCLHFSTTPKLENKVGSPPNWAPLLNLYWSLLPLVMSKEHGDPYELDRPPLVDHSLCDEQENTMRCENVCRLQLEGRGFLATPFCYYLSRRQYGMDHHYGECWSVSNMRCWNRNGRIDVMDRDTRKFWSINRHYNGRKEHTEENWLTDPDFRYLHLRSLEQEKDLFLFGWGNVREIQEICDILNDFQTLLKSIDTIPPNHEIILGGHSEGSGWAYCFNEYLSKRGLPNERRVIASGVLVANEELLDRMDPYSRENSLFLTVGNLLPEHLVGGGMMPDVLPMKYKEKGTTFPMFGYKCDQRGDECLGFEENPLDFNAGLQWVHRGCQSADDRGVMSRLVKDVHMFSNYRDCYRVCIHEFRKVNGFNFQTNVPSFSVKKVGGTEDNPLIEAGMNLDKITGMEKLSLGAAASSVQDASTSSSVEAPTNGPLQALFRMLPRRAQ